MRKLFVLLCAGLLVCASFGTAVADVDVDTGVEKDWKADVSVDVDLDKRIYLGIKQLAPVDSSAEADVTKNDANVGNVVVEIPITTVTPGNDILEEPDTVTVNPVEPSAILSAAAFNTATGVISVNQAPGNANNQGNAVAVAYADGNPAFLNAAVHVEKEIGTSDEKLDAGLIGTLLKLLVPVPDEGWANLGGTNIVVGLQTPRDNTITDTAYQNAAGVIGVNQSAGNVNNQDNAVALAVGATPRASLAESDLGMVTANNIIAEVDVEKTDQINASAFASASGIMSVNQSAGNCNNQANSVAVTVSQFTMAW